MNCFSDFLKGMLEPYVHLALVIIIGILLIIGLFSRLSPLESPGGRAFELAMLTAMHIDALSTVGEGEAMLDTGKYRYDVEVQKRDGIWRSIASSLTSLMDKNGYYVAVSPYDEKGKKELSFFIISSYKLNEEHKALLTSTSSICIEKELSDAVAKVVACQG